MHDSNYFACVPPCRESEIFVGSVAAVTGMALCHESV